MGGPHQTTPYHLTPHLTTPYDVVLYHAMPNHAMHTMPNNYINLFHIPTQGPFLFF